MALAIMKTQKFPSCRSAQDLNADEMKQVSENENPTHNKDDEKSGTGGIIPGLPDLFDNEIKHQVAACEGKNRYDSCTWSYDGISHSGICNYSYGDKKNYCSVVSASGVGSGTGGLSAKVAACLNKVEKELCYYIGEDGKTKMGHCLRDASHLTAHPFRCSNFNKEKDYSKQ